MPGHESRQKGTCLVWWPRADRKYMCPSVLDTGRGSRPQWAMSFHSARGWQPLGHPITYLSPREWGKPKVFTPKLPTLGNRKEISLWEMWGGGGSVRKREAIQVLVRTVSKRRNQSQYTLKSSGAIIHLTWKRKKKGPWEKPHPRMDTTTHPALHPHHFCNPTASEEASSKGEDRRNTLSSFPEW